ncbi:Hypothetical predicted protein, partial [Xyrichtys novacula]
SRSIPSSRGEEWTAAMCFIAVNFSWQREMMKKCKTGPDGYSSLVYCEGLDIVEADEGSRILEET